MRDLTLDFESYYDKDYSLTKMTTQEYLEDQRFETIGCAVIEEGSEALWIDGPDVKNFLDGVDWGSTNLIGHNLLFDGGVLARHYGYFPKLYSCTLCYARAIMGALLPKFNLETVAANFNMKKDVGALLSLRGMRYADVIQDEHTFAWERYKKYATNDAIQSKTIYNILKPHMPDAERVVVDIIIRMFTQGNLVLDPVMLEEALLDARTESASKLAAAGITDVKELRSRGEFAQKLINLGINPPMKVSPANGEMTYAFSKDDLAFMELLQHPDARVRILVEAKLNAASTILESRAERLRDISKLTPEHRLQVPLCYSGAHTHRFSGLDKLNLQNIPGNEPDKPSKLRHSIRAPKGYKLIVRDASQIEARILAYIAGQWDLIKQFANGEDVYSSFAGTVYDKPINKKEHPTERFIGKTGILGLGYGSGAWTFQHMVLTSKSPVPIDEEFSQKVVNTYRDKYTRIVKFWRMCSFAMESMVRDEMTAIGPCYTGCNKLRLPSGLFLTYPMLERLTEEEGDWHTGDWRYYKPRYRAYTKIFGAKICENIVQALARIQITDTMLKMRVTNPDWHCALQVHDELIYVAPDDEAEDCMSYLTKYISDQPKWTNNIRLPLSSDGGIGEVYGEIK